MPCLRDTVRTPRTGAGAPYHSAYTHPGYPGWVSLRGWLPARGVLGVIEEGASTVNQVVARRRALGSRRALWFYLAAVTAIIAGLLAMHSLSLEEDQAGTVVSASAVVAAPDAAADVLVSGVATPSCDETVCGTSHAFAAVTCLLALLTLLILVLPARDGWMSLLAWLRSLPGRSGSFTSGSPLLRPSLIVLSISRT